MLDLMKGGGGDLEAASYLVTKFLEITNRSRALRSTLIEMLSGFFLPDNASIFMTLKRVFFSPFSNSRVHETNKLKSDMKKILKWLDIFEQALEASKLNLLSYSLYFFFGFCQQQKTRYFAQTNHHIASCEACFT